MDPVAASESFLQQIGQNIVRTLFGGKETEEKNQEATKECEPNLPPQDVGTTAEVGETSVDPPDEKAVSVQENRNDAPTTHPPGPDMSERPHPGQTEHSILQERKTGISDSSQPTVADEEVTERHHGHDDKITQIAVASAEPLKSPENRALQGDVQNEQLHRDSQGLHNMPEDTTVQDSAGPTGIEDKFIDKTQIQLQMQPQESLQDMSGETLSKDKTAHTSHQESEESVCTTQSPGADSSESSLAADAGTASVPLPRSSSDQPAGVKDEEKIVTLSGQREEYDSDTVDPSDTDKTALDSGVSSASKKITSSRDTMSEDVQPSPPLAAKSDQPLQSDQEQQQSPNPDSHISIPDVQADVEDTEDLCNSVEKAVATETKGTEIGIPVNTPGAEQESNVGYLHEQFSCLLEGTKSTDTAAPENKPEAVQETGASENIENSSYSQAMTEATYATMPIDASQVVREAPSKDSQEKPPCSHAGMKEADTAVVQDTSQAKQDSGAGDLTEKPPCSQAGTAISDSVMTVDFPQVLQDSPSSDIVDTPSSSQAGMQENDSNIPADAPQAEQESGTGDISKESPRSQAHAETSDSVKPVYVPQAPPESGSDDIQEKAPSSQANVKETDTIVFADTPQAKPGICTGEIQGDSPCPPAGTKATDAAMAVNMTQSNPESGVGDLQEKPSNIEVETEESNPVIAVNKAGADQESSTEETRRKPPFCHARTAETDTAMPTDPHQAVQETDVREIQKMSSHPQAAGLSKAGSLKVEATNSTTLDIPRSVLKPCDRKIRKKSSCIQVGIQNIRVSADTHQKARDSGAGGVYEESLLPQARTEETDIPVSVDISQADQESGAGDIREKSPHAHADAKISKSGMLEVPTCTHTETKEPDITMPADTSEADQERGARERSSQTDAMYLKLTAAEANAKKMRIFFKKMKSRLAVLFDTLPDSDQEHNIIKPLLGKVLMSDLVLLKGSNGCGKTTAALMLARHYVIEKKHDIIWMNTAEALQINNVLLQQQSYIFIDDFLGKSASESSVRWKSFYSFMTNAKSSKNDVRFVLTTRASILDDLIARTGAELNFIKDVVTISLDHVKLWKNTKTTKKMKSPVDLEPSCGFPLCCYLVPHVPADIQSILFQQPMLALRQAVRRMMDSKDIARSALALLALSEDGLDTSVLLDPFKPAVLKKLLQILQLEEQTLKDIVSFYRHCHGFIQVQGDLISFTNEAVQDAVLVVLTQSQPKFLSTNCSIKLQSQLALATSDDCKDSDEAEKPRLPDLVLQGFVQSIIEEIQLRNYQQAFSSTLFELCSFRKMLESTMIQENLLKKCLDTSGFEGLHFLFYAGAVDFIWKHSIDVLNKADHWLVLQALLACCYWGHDQDVPTLLQVFKKKQKLKNLLKDATIQTIVRGNLLGISKKTEPDWERTPMYPEDTLLTMAAWRGNDAVVKLLVERGMAVNCRGKDGRTALVHYCARGNGAMVQFLLEKNADASLSDDNGQIPLMHALLRKEWAIPENLFTQSNCDTVDGHQMSTVMIACACRRSVQTIEKLINHGVELTPRDYAGYTCLHHACLSGSTDIVSFLLERHKMNSSLPTNEGFTPLILAVTSPGRSQLVQVLMRSLKPKDAIDERVVIHACRYSDRDVVELLFKFIHVSDKLLLLALHSASKFGNFDIVRYLILHCNVNPADVIFARGHNLLHMATFGSNLECIKFLLRKINPNSLTPSQGTSLLFALGHGRVDFARQLRSAGAKTDAVDSNGNGCLHYAVESQSLRALQWCIEEEGMEVNMKTLKGITPLYKAIGMEDARLVQYLLDKGADINAAHVNGVTALDMAKLLGVKNVLDVLLTKASH